MPLDGILVETDAPWLAPAPKRGQRNEPALVAQTARILAGLLGVSEEIASVTTKNFYRLFPSGRSWETDRGCFTPRIQDHTMAQDNSFDIVSKVDIQEVRNAIDQALKEIRQRFDLKDSHSEVNLEGQEPSNSPRSTNTSWKRSKTFSARSWSSVGYRSRTSPMAK